MLDLETLSTAPNAVILTIGAVKFSRRGSSTSLDDTDHFYRRIDTRSCVDAGMHICLNTQSWWEQQDGQARHEAFGHEDRIPLVQALKEFNEWFRGTRHLWSHGSSFDCVILEQAYKACGLKAPWLFWTVRDTRTIFDLAKVRIKDFPVKVEHHALHDAFRQVQALHASMDKLGLRNDKVQRK